MTEQELAAITAQLAAITPGPWALRDRSIGEVDDAFIEIYPIIEYWEGALTRADATLIAHAPATIGALLAEVERLRQELTAAKEHNRDLMTAYEGLRQQARGYLL